MTCVKCHSTFEPTPSQERKGYRMCLPCRRVYRKEWTAKRRAQGFIVKGGKQSLEAQRKRKAKYKLDPVIKKRNAEYARAQALNPKHRQKHLTRWKTRRLIASGKLVKGPCIDCGSSNVQAHHEDYNDPYTVTWLCRACHSLRHKRQAKGG